MLGGIIHYHDISQFGGCIMHYFDSCQFLTEDIALMWQLTGGSDKFGYVFGAILCQLKEGGAWLGRFMVHYCDR